MPIQTRVAAKLVQCLNCGETRIVAKRLQWLDECGRCGYVGWADAESLTETLRRVLRETTLGQRRISAAAW